MMDDRLAESIWRSAVESAGLKEYDAILRAAARPCFRIGRLIGDIYAQVGNSRFGGKPDLPAGLAWPLDAGAAMTFLAQINLAELEPGFVPELPAQGWLYFFLGRDGQWGALPHQVVYFAGSAAELHRQGPPAGTPPVEAVCPRNFAPHEVDFVPQYAIKFESPVWKQIGLHPFSVESMRKKEAFYQEHTQISGYELTFNGEPARNAYFSRHNVEEPFYSRHETDEHIVAANNDARERGDIAALEYWQGELELFYQSRAWLQKHGPRIASWRPPLVLESLRMVGMMWVDAGFVQFMIQQNDLLAQNFNNTYCEIMTT